MIEIIIYFDFLLKTVTPKNFINVLLGKKDAMKGVGSGKVLER